MSLRIGVKLIFISMLFNCKALCSSRMASLSQRRCIRFFEKNILRIFFNSDFVGTEPNEAPYETTGNSVELQELITLKFSSDLKLLFAFPAFLSLTPMRYVSSGRTVLIVQRPAGDSRLNAKLICV
jgi:hypothetical protein